MADKTLSYTATQIDNAILRTGDITLYGAVAGGADNTAVIQTCLDTLTHIFIPAGLFYVTGHLHFDVPGVTIEGESMYTSMLITSAVDDMFIVGADVEYVNIKNLSLRGNYTAGQAENLSSKRCFVFANNSVQWHIEYVLFMGFYGPMIDNSDGGHVNNIYISHCEFRTGYKAGIHLVSDNAYQVNGIVIRECDVTTFETNGIELWGANLSILYCCLQACDQFGITLNSLETTTINGHCQAVDIIGNYYEQCWRGFLQISTCQGNGVDEWTGYDGSHYVYGLRVNSNFGDDGYAGGETQAEQDALDAYGVIDMRSNNKSSMNITGFVYNSNALNIGNTDAKYAINTHNLMKTSVGHEISFLSYNSRNIDVFYPQMNISPSYKYETLIPLSMEYTASSHTYRCSAPSGGYNYVYFTKENFNAADASIKYYFKTDGYNVTGDGFLVNGDYCYKATQDVEDFTAYSQITNATPAYVQLSSDTPIFHEMTMALPYINLGATAQAAYNVRYRLAIYLPNSVSATYFEIKNIYVQSTK